MRVLGIDPGTRIVGYGLVEPQGYRIIAVGFGAIRAPMNAPYAERLLRIRDEIVRVIRQEKPDAVAIEEAFYGKSASAALRMGEGRGVALVAVAQESRPLYQYTPAEVKKAVVGNGRAHKSQVQQMVRMILGLREAPEPEDAADALAVAICHCNRARFTDRRDFQIRISNFQDGFGEADRSLIGYWKFEFEIGDSLPSTASSAKSQHQPLQNPGVASAAGLAIQVRLEHLVQHDLQLGDGQALFLAEQFADQPGLARRRGGRFRLPSGPAGRVA